MTPFPGGGAPAASPPVKEQIAMSTAKELEVALFYLQSECYKAGFPETGYLVEVARLSLDDTRQAERAEAPVGEADNLVWLRV